MKLKQFIQTLTESDGPRVKMGDAAIQDMEERWGITNINPKFIKNPMTDKMNDSVVFYNVKSKTVKGADDLMIFALSKNDLTIAIKYPLHKNQEIVPSSQIPSSIAKFTKPGWVLKTTRVSPYMYK